MFMANQSTVKPEFIEPTFETQPQTRFEEVVGLFRTVSVAPAGKPRRASDQIVVYVNGGTLRLYWFDAKAGVWHYVTATA